MIPSEYKHTIAVDWDGTCVSFAWPDRSLEWMPGAVKNLHRLAKNFYVIIWTSRIAPVDPWGKPRSKEELDGEVQYIRDMLDEAGLTEVDVFTHPWKPGASVYIDDKAERYRGNPGSWDYVTQEVEDRLTAIPAELPHLQGLVYE